MKQNMLNTSQLRNFLYVSIISADNDDLTEEEKQAIIQRTDPKNLENTDWVYALEPIKDIIKRAKYVKVMKEINSGE